MMMMMMTMMMTTMMVMVMMIMKDIGHYKEGENQIWVISGLLEVVYFFNIFRSQRIDPYSNSK